jgi:hypothetical protein
MEPADTTEETSSSRFEERFFSVIFIFRVCRVFFPLK